MSLCFEEIQVFEPTRAGGSPGGAGTLVGADAEVGGNGQDDGVREVPGGGGAVAVIPDAQKFFQGVIMLLIGFGIGFELPVVVFYLVIFNIVPYKKLRQQWRVVYVVLMVVASAATPDWSPWTMGGLFVSLGVLYELSMLLARITLRKRIAAQKAAEIELYGETIDDSDDES